MTRRKAIDSKILEASKSFDAQIFIENNCHWVADIIFGEDFSLTDRGNSTENMGLFQEIGRAHV